MQVSARDKKRAEILERIIKAASILTGDLNRANDLFAEKVLGYKPTDPIDWDLPFAVKTAIRALFSHVEAISQMMKAEVLANASFLGLTLTSQAVLQLSERKIKKATGQEIADLHTPVEGLKIAAKFFPALFGITGHQLPNDSRWLAFLSIVSIRNAFTHPKLLEDLAAGASFAYWTPAYQGYLSIIHELIRICANTVPRVSLTPGDELPKYRHQPAQPPIFSPSDMDQIAEHPGRAFDYFKHAYFALVQDSGRAQNLALRLAQTDSLIDPAGQFGLRSFAQTTVAEFEGTLALARFFIDASVLRGEIALSAAEVASLENASTLEALESVLEIWAREFGHGGLVPEEPQLRDAAVRLMTLRDRLTHPKRLEDLTVSLNELEVIVHGCTWLKRVTSVLSFGDSWIVKATASAKRFDKSPSSP